jgi:hypothetical protein
VYSVTINQLLTAQEVTKNIANRAVDIRVENRTQDAEIEVGLLTTTMATKYNILCRKYLDKVTSYRVPGQLRNLVS